MTSLTFQTNLPAVKAVGRGLGWGMAALVFAPSAASAANLDWSAPPECGPDAFAQQLSDDTRRTLEQLPVDALIVRIAQGETTGANRWSVQVSFRTRSGSLSATREIAGESCTDVSRAAAVAIAMALAEDQTLTKAATSGEDTGLGETSRVAPEPDDRRPASAAPRVTRQPEPAAFLVRPFVFGELSGDTALMAQPTFAGGLGAGLGIRRWDVGVRGAVARPTEHNATTALGVSLSGYWTEAFGCVVLNEQSRPSLCLGYGLDVVQGRGRGSGLEVARTQTAWWSSLHPHLAVAARLNGGFDVRVRIGVAFGLNQPAFVYDMDNVAYALPRVTFRGALALVWGR